MNFLPPSNFVPSPLSLDEIIATQIKVPCKTLVRFRRFGYLEPSLGSEDLPAGVDVELPLWAAEALSKRGYIRVSAPKNYKEGVREVLKADPAVVDLNKLGPHFYQSGLHIAALPTDDSEDIAELLPEVLQRRFISMADSYNFTNTMKTADIGDRTGNLIRESYMDAMEQRLFDVARKGAEEIAQWLEK